MSGRGAPGLNLVARLLVRWTTPASHRDDLERSLAEEAARVRRERGAWTARRWLLRELGGVAVHGIRDRVASAPDGFRGLDADVRLALRRMRTAPGFTAVAAVTLALALGVTSAVFSVVDAFFLRPLPYGEPGRLVALWETLETSPEITTVSPPNVRDWEREARTLETVAWFNGAGMTLTDGGETVRVAGSVASVDLFDVLGVAPALGGGFRPEHARPDTVVPARVVVLSHGLWVRRFGADPGVIGQSIELSEEDHEVVGVMPEGFRHPRTFLSPEPAELWVPIGFGGGGTNRDLRYLHVVARLAAGATLADARAEMASLGATLAREFPDANAGRTVVVRPVDEQIFGDQRPVLVLLLAAAGLVLLVACVNMASLLLARGIAREREFAVRAALGSGRAAILRQLLVEGVMLALIGGVLGAALLLAGKGAFRTAVAPWLNPLADVRIDGRVVLFTLGAAVGSGLLFGALPTFRLARPDLRAALTTRGGSNDGARARARLVAVEAALTVVLVFSAGLLGRGLLRLLQAPPGFRVERTVLFEVRPPSDRYASSDEVLAFYARLRESLEALPEIRSTGLLSDIPLTSENRGTSFTVPASDRPAEETGAEFHNVGPGYFAAAGIPLLEGREFTDADDPDVPFVAIVNRALARRLWGDGSPLGATLHMTLADVDVTVVGVVGNTVDDAMDAPLEPRLFFASGQAGARTYYVVAHTTVPAREALAVVRPAVARVDPRVPVAELGTMEDHVARSVSTPMGLAGVTALFGALALLLAAVGVYGVLAHGVAERTRELGVRAALGAGRSSLVGLVVRDSARVAGPGLLVGTVLALTAGPVLANQVASVRPWDPAVLAATAASVAAAALLAAWIPARRASGVDPSEALRSD